MQIASKMAGFSLGEADVLRKAMGKKMRQRHDVHAGQVHRRARSRTRFPEKTAVQVFDLMEQFAQYGFNKSHSTAYALLAYQTAYLKVHYPVQFMAALLSSEIGKTDKIVMYIAECKDMGIPVLPPDINESELNFRSVGGSIRFGMLAIRNVGEGAIRSMLQFRRRKRAIPEPVPVLRGGGLAGGQQACSREPDQERRSRLLRLEARAVDGNRRRRHRARPESSSAIARAGRKGYSAICPRAKLQCRIRRPRPCPNGTHEQLLAYEKETLGYYVSGHPLDRYVAGTLALCQEEPRRTHRRGQQRRMQAARDRHRLPDPAHQEGRTDGGVHAGGPDRRGRDCGVSEGLCALRVVPRRGHSHIWSPAVSRPRRKRRSRSSHPIFSRCRGLPSGTRGCFRCGSPWATSRPRLPSSSTGSSQKIAARPESTWNCTILTISVLPSSPPTLSR